jgi:hypothetical protein
MCDVFMYYRDWQRLAGRAGFGIAENTILFPCDDVVALLWFVIIHQEIILWRSVLIAGLIWYLISVLRNEVSYDRGLLIFNGYYAIFDGVSMKKVRRC